MSLVTLRDRALSPCMFTDVLPEGVLSRIGYALWEQPPGAEGGYMHWLHDLDLVAWNLYLQAPLREEASIATRDHFEAIQQLILDSPHGQLILDDLQPGEVYSAGTSLSYQNGVFSPQATALGQPPDFHNPIPEVDQILAEWNGFFDMHCGIANNSSFYTGNLYFNLDFALQCRAADNPYRVATDFTTYGIAANELVTPEGSFGADSVVRTWPKTTYDPSIPSVFQLALDSIEALVTEYGPTIRYLIHGETTLTILAADGEPRTNYSVAGVQGFRNYMENVLGLTIVQANARWGTAYANYAAVDPSLAPFGALEQQRQDWIEYQTYLVTEMATVEQHAALAIDHEIESTTFRFGPPGMCRSWLESRFGAVGDWIGDTTEQYLASRALGMRTTACAARLSGTGTAFPITAPAHIANATPIGTDQPLSMRAWWSYYAREWGYLYADLLTCQTVEVGYLKSQQVSFGADSASVDAFAAKLAELRADHPAAYARSGPYQRFNIQVADWNDGDGDGSGDTGKALLRLLRDEHLEAAVFDSPRVLSRHLARNWLARSVNFVLHPADLDGTKDIYVALQPDGSPGLTVLVRFATGALPAWADPTVVYSNWYGSLHRVLDGVTPTNVWLFDCRPLGNCDASLFWKGLARSLMLALPLIETEIAAHNTIAWMRSPIELDAADQAVELNWVTDGVNFTAHVANLTAVPQQITLSIREEVQSALEVAFEDVGVVLGPYETRALRLDAIFSGIDLAASIADAQAKLTLLGGAGYDIAAGQDLIDQATALSAANPARALAAYIAAVRAIYLNTSYAAPNVTVLARRITLPGGANSENPDGAAVQLLYPLNGREEGTSGTIAGGQAVLALGAPTVPHWNFATNNVAAPAATANDQVEVHVVDARGSASRQLLLTP